MEKMNDTKALAVIPRSLSEVQTMAEVLAKSTLIPDALRNKVPDVVVQILAGQELGLAPMASIRGVHIVQGKPVLSADTMVALALGSGLCEYFSCVEETSTQVTYEDTKTAGLNTKENWRMHKRQMRRARAKAILARDVYPDVLAGCFDPDEMQVPIDRSNVIEADFVETPDVEPAEFAELEQTADEAATKEVGARMAKLPPKWKQLANERYKARLKFHREQKEPAA